MTLSRLLPTRLLLAKMMLTMLASALLVCATPTLAQNPAPEVSVRQEADQTIREYRLNGHLYAIRIEPGNGAAYFLVDRTGNGNFERQQGDSVPVPGWVK